MTLFDIFISISIIYLLGKVIMLTNEISEMKGRMVDNCNCKKKKKKIITEQN